MRVVFAVLLLAALAGAQPASCPADWACTGVSSFVSPQLFSFSVSRSPLAWEVRVTPPPAWNNPRRLDFAVLVDGEGLVCQEFGEADKPRARYCYRDVIAFRETGRPPGCAPDKQYTPECDTVIDSLPLANPRFTECCRNESGVLGWYLVANFSPQWEISCRFFTETVNVTTPLGTRTYGPTELKCSVWRSLANLDSGPTDPLAFRGWMTYGQPEIPITPPFVPTDIMKDTSVDFGRALPQLSTTASMRLANSAEVILPSNTIIVQTFRANVFQNTTTRLEVITPADFEPGPNALAPTVAWDPGLGDLLGNEGPDENGNCPMGYVNSNDLCVAVCQLSPFCSGHGSCLEIPVVQCACNSQNGFGWMGAACETASCPNNCNNHGECAPGTGAFPFCSCSTGWSGSTCATPVCPQNCNFPNGTCDGSTGTPTCQCEPGFSPPTCDGLTCPACQNGGTCNTQTGLCECTGIFYGSQCQFFTCPGFDADTSTPNCNGNGWCNATTSYSCDCFPDWGGSDCATPTCADTLQSCSSPNGTCVFNNDQLQCDCETGFSLPTCTPQCPVCLNGGTCDVPTGTCQCTGIFYGSDCSQYTCPGYDAQQGIPNCNGRGVCNAGTGYACQCVDNWSGTACETPTCTDTLDGCNAPNGTCIANGNTAQCDCDNMHAGLKCETELVADQCPTCVNGGTCEAPNTTCSCPENFYGALCEQFTCLVHPTCNGHGSCTASNLACNCDDNWGGDACQTPTCGDTLDFCSSPNGTCVVAAGTPQCNCNAGFSPPTCLVNCPSCVNGGTCAPGSGVCTCPTGFYGSQCQLFDCDGHPNCNGHGSCTAANRVCSCNLNWGGVACGTPTCADTLLSCRSPNGTCVAPLGTPECDCGAKFEGPTCTPQCPVCLNQGTCNSNFECDCVSPFFGANCALFQCPGYVKDVSENCNGRGTCSAATNYQCQCSIDFSGSPDCSVRSCPTDYCKNGGTCSLPPLESSPLVCTCVDGWLGAQCDGSRRCESGMCQNNATCSIESNNVLVCGCQAGYSGARCQNRSATGAIEPWLIGVIVGAAVVGIALAVLIVLLTRYLRRRHTAEGNARLRQTEMTSLQPNPANQ